MPLCGASLAVVVCLALGATWGLIDSFGPASPAATWNSPRSWSTATANCSAPTSRARPLAAACHRDQVDPRYLDVLFAYEDKRFFQHSGVDPLASAVPRCNSSRMERSYRAARPSPCRWRACSSRAPNARSMSSSGRRCAPSSSSKLSKDQILGLYLTLAPYGGNLEGIRAALSYFGKEPKRLTLGERTPRGAAAIARARRPDRFHASAVRARDRVLDRMARHGVFSADEIARAKLEPVPHTRKKMPMIAPHAADDAIAGTPNAREIRLTIDGSLQRLWRRSHSTAPARLGRRCRSPSWSSTMRAARCSPALLRRIISTSAAQGRSTSPALSVRLVRR